MKPSPIVALPSALLSLIALGVPQIALAASPGQNSLVFRTRYSTYSVSAAGQNLHFADRATGRDYCIGSPYSAFATVRAAGREFPATSIGIQGDRLHVVFGSSGTAADLRVGARRDYLTIEVLSITGPNVEELAFPNVALSLHGTSDEPFAACALALNINTNVAEIPGPSRSVRAVCYSRFGMVGAKVAIVAAPRGRLREVMKEVVSEAPDLPHSPLGGPWAWDAPAARESYLFNFGNMSEKTVGSWIALAHSLGITQIDFHGGDSFRFGDYRPNPTTYPRGLDSLKAVVSKLHAAGIQAGLHTYAMFMEKGCPWVTPVPDRRLAVQDRFTLRTALSADADSIPVNEPTAAVSTATGFQVENSVTLRIDDELITFSDVAKQPPYAFTRCQRGACGTHRAAHAAGAGVSRLKELFGMFAPDGDSSLMGEMAARQADVINSCGFDMVYIDALDGSFAVCDGPFAWHYSSKFVFDLWRRLSHPVLMEMSTFHHHLWYVRSRLGAWDCPARGYKPYLDAHALVNEDNDRVFLPSHLGWWAVFPWDGVQPDRVFPDDIEYLLTRCLAYDCGLSLFRGFDPESFRKSRAERRLAEMVRRYQELRRSRRLSERVKRRLRVPGDEYTLTRGPNDGWSLQPIQYARHQVACGAAASQRWRATNRFGRQTAGLRIEANLSPAPYTSPEAIVLADFASADPLPIRAANTGVTMTCDLGGSGPDGIRCAKLTAESRLATADGSWAKVGKVLAPTIDLNHRGIGCWVHGDGQGEVLNIQIASPENVTIGLADHYVVIDFIGWRYVELVEPESNRLNVYTWPYTQPERAWRANPLGALQSALTTYQPWVDYSQIGRLSLWLNNLPPGRKVECLVSAIKGLPLRSVKLKNPQVTLGGKTIVFPTDLASGSYLEYSKGGSCTVYGPTGEVIRKVAPRGEPPIAAPAANDLEFKCDGEPGFSSRAGVTVITIGSPFPSR